MTTQYLAIYFILIIQVCAQYYFKNVTHHLTGYDQFFVELGTNSQDNNYFDYILDQEYIFIFNKEICQCNEYYYVAPDCRRYNGVCSPYMYPPFLPQSYMSRLPEVAEHWPYLISFQKVENPDKPNCYRHFCGGSLITPNLVLTAAHCFKKYLNYNQFEGVPIIDIYAALNPACRHAGSRPEYTAGKRARVTYMYVHPDFDGFTGNADIAILVLDALFDGPYVTLNANNSFTEGTSLYAAGYGAVNQQEMLDPTMYIMRQPLQGKVDYISPQQCRSLLLQFNSTTDLREDTMICAYDRWGDTCQGDSGGPLSIHKNLEQWKNNDIDILVGIISWGPPDQCQSRFVDQAPIVATKISAFVDWIKDTLDSYRTSISSLSDLNMQNFRVKYLKYKISLERGKNLSESERRKSVISLRQQISQARELFQTVRNSRVKFQGEERYSIYLSPQQEMKYENGG